MKMAKVEDVQYHINDLEKVQNRLGTGAEGRLVLRAEIADVPMVAGVGGGLFDIMIRDDE